MFDTIHRIISCCPITVQAYCEQGDADSEEQRKQDMKDADVHMVSKLLQPIIHRIADQGYNEYKRYTYVVQERAIDKPYYLPE